MSNEPGLPRQFLQRCLLLLLCEQPDYGYDLVERLSPFGFDGSDPGRVYRTLRAMERGELVRSAWRPSGVGPYRRVYEVTEVGRRELRRAAQEIGASRGLMDAFLTRCECFGSEVVNQEGPLAMEPPLGRLATSFPPSAPSAPA